MRLQLDSMSKIKNILHGVQGGLLAIAMILTIAIFTRSGKSDARVGWYVKLFPPGPRPRFANDAPGTSAFAGSVFLS